MTEQYYYKKLDEDDILEILMEHFQDDELAGVELSQGCILGTPGKDLRFIGVFSKDSSEKVANIDFEKIDETIDFNGDHSFLKSNPEFYIK